MTSSHSSVPPPQGVSGRPPHKRHPAGRARAVALAASVTATGGIGVAMAYGEGAFSGGDEPPGQTAQVPPPSTTPTVAPAPAATPSSTPSSTTPTSGTVVDEPTSVDRNETSTADSADATAVEVDDAPIETGTGGYPDGEYLGKANWIQWGYIQVEVTFRDGQIADIELVRRPRDRRSTEINNEAEPILRAQALENQSSVLDIVSGATYTSRSYARSLQAALDLAALDQAAVGPSAPDEPST